MSDKWEDMALALLLKLSYSILKQSQNNTAVVQQERVDRVGFEPTTSAYSKMLFITYLENIMKSDNLAVQILPAPLKMLKVVLYLARRRKDKIPTEFFSYCLPGAPTAAGGLTVQLN
jgi:hypothetical protein